MLLLLLVAVVVVHASPHHQSAPVGTVAAAAAGQVAGDEILIAVVSCVLGCLVCKDGAIKKALFFKFRRVILGPDFAKLLIVFPSALRSPFQLDDDFSPTRRIHPIHLPSILNRCECAGEEERPCLLPLFLPISFVCLMIPPPVLPFHPRPPPRAVSRGINASATGEAKSKAFGHRCYPAHQVVRGNKNFPPGEKGENQELSEEERRGDTYAHKHLSMRGLLGMRLHTALPLLLLHLIERRLETGRKCVDICFLSEVGMARPSSSQAGISLPCQQQVAPPLPQQATATTAATRSSHPRTAAG